MSSTGVTTSLSSFSFFGDLTDLVLHYFTRAKTMIITHLGFSHLHILLDSYRDNARITPFLFLRLVFGHECRVEVSEREGYTYFPSLAIAIAFLQSRDRIWRTSTVYIHI